MGVSNLKLEIWLERRFISRWLSPKNALFNGKTPFFLVGLHWCRATFFLKVAGSNYKNYWSNAGQVKQKFNCGKFSLEFNSVRIAAHKEDRLWNMAKSTWKSKFHFLPYAIFSTTDQCSVMPSENFALSSINKDQLEDLQN